MKPEDNLKLNFLLNDWSGVLTSLSQGEDLLSSTASSASGRGSSCFESISNDKRMAFWVSLVRGARLLNQDDTGHKWDPLSPLAANASFSISWTRFNK